jgi:hypothetical protein
VLSLSAIGFTTFDAKTLRADHKPDNAPRTLVKAKCPRHHKELALWRAVD